MINDNKQGFPSTNLEKVKILKIKTFDFIFYFIKFNLLEHFYHLFTAFYWQLMHVCAFIDFYAKLYTCQNIFFFSNCMILINLFRVTFFSQLSIFLLMVLILSLYLFFRNKNFMSFVNRSLVIQHIFKYCVLRSLIQ